MSGLSTEEFTCTPGNLTVCCEIIHFDQCNKVRSCLDENGISINCDNGSPNKDIACALNRQSDLDGQVCKDAAFFAGLSSPENYAFFGTQDSIIPCWDPKFGSKLFCSPTSRSCLTTSDGSGSCSDYLPMTGNDTHFYCTPATGQTGGCNNIGPLEVEMTSNLTELSGSAWKCYDPSTHTFECCESFHWSCVTTIDGVGSCAAEPLIPSADYCMDENTCNRVTRGGCWSAIEAKLAEWVQGANFCETNFETGATIEAITCTPSDTVGCCAILDYTQCSKIKYCMIAGEASACETDLPGKDHACAIRKSDGSRMCVGGANSIIPYATLKPSDEYIYFNTPDANITCWDPSDQQPIMCQESERFCLTNLTTGEGACGSVPNYIEYNYALTMYYLTPSSLQYYCIPSTGQTGGCNNYGPIVPMTNGSMELSGTGMKCWDPSTSMAIECTSADWQCETTIDGVGKCAGIPANDSYTCSEDEALCNKISFCWDNANDRLEPQCKGTTTKACRESTIDDSPVCAMSCDNESYNETCCYFDNCNRRERISDAYKFQMNSTFLLLFIASLQFFQL
jgi:hypothetical protein